MYEGGRGGLPKDYAQAVAWYRKAADGGNASAMSDLDLVYPTGRAWPKDDAQAVVWYRKAADAGNTEAMENLRRVDGEGVAGAPRR